MRISPLLVALVTLAAALPADRARGQENPPAAFPPQAIPAQESAPAALPPPLAQGPAPDLNLVFTSQVAGWIEPCG